MSRASLAVLLATLIALGGVLVVSPEQGTAKEEDVPDHVRDYRARQDKAGYVGSAACKACHAEAHARWQESSHFHTYLPADAKTLPGDVLDEARVAHTPGSTHYAKGDEHWMAETVGPDGRQTRYPLTHVVGRMRIRMYVTTLPDGRKQVLPAMLEVPTGAWFDYTKLLFGGGGTDWDTPPVVEPWSASFWTGPTRSWDSGCARCHTSGSEPLGPDDPSPGPRTVERALGVDCESCHGPGFDHLAFHEMKKAIESSGDLVNWDRKDPILRFADLPHDRQLSLCLQCHMEADLVDRSFMPGDDVFEHVDPTLMVDPERIDPTGRVVELIYDGLPFSASRCVQEGKLTCITCHDPHGSSQPSQMKTDPASPTICIACHQEIGEDVPGHTFHGAESAGSTCVACHMPFLTIERGHGVVADHSISVPRLGGKADRLAQDACTWCHSGGLYAAETAPRLSADDLKTAYDRWWPDGGKRHAWMDALAAARLKEPGAEKALLEVIHDKGNYRVVRASATALLGKHTYAKKAPLALMLLAADDDSLVRREAIRALGALEGAPVDRLLVRALKDPSRAVQLAAARAAATGWTRIQDNEALRDAVLPVLWSDAETISEDWVRWFLYAGVSDIAGNKEEALRAYKRVAWLDPFASHVRTRIEQLETELAKR